MLTSKQSRFEIHRRRIERQRVPFRLSRTCIGRGYVAELVDRDGERIRRCNFHRVRTDRKIDGHWAGQFGTTIDEVRPSESRGFDLKRRVFDRHGGRRYVEQLPRVGDTKTDRT